MSRKRRIARVNEEIRALRAQLRTLGADADLMTRRAQLELEIEAKERERRRLTAREND